MEAAGSYWLDLSCREPSCPSAGACFEMEGGRGTGPGASRGQQDLQIHSPDALSGPACWGCAHQHKFQV